MVWIFVEILFYLMFVWFCHSFRLALKMWMRLKNDERKWWDWCERALSDE